MIEQLLKNRGITKENKHALLELTKEELPSVLLMKDAQEFIDQLFDRIKQQKRIVVVGDYDCDGVCSTTVMVRGIKELSKALTGTEGRVSFIIPHRFKEGYGISKRVIDRLKRENPKAETIITVDNGIVAFEAIEYANSLGLEVFVTDHHTGKEELPKAKAVVNPNRIDCDYPFKGLSGTGVAYKLLVELAKQHSPETVPTIEALIDFVGLSVVSDVLPVLEENRYFLKEALKSFNGELDQPLRFGFQSLINELIKGKKHTKGNTITETDFGFSIGPMINAQSRVHGEADLAIELFLSRNSDDVREKANFLYATNEKRKLIMNEVLDRYAYGDYKPGELIVVRADGIGDGIIGLLASRLAENYSSPVVVFTETEDGKALKGSARTQGDENFSIIKALRQVEHLTAKLGGHAGAAGLSIPVENYEDFVTELKAVTDKEFHKQTVRLEGELVFHEGELTESIIEELDSLRPYGPGFAYPTVELKDVRVGAVKTMGANNQHLKVEVPDGTEVILWNDAEAVMEDLDEAESFSIIGVPSVNSFLGKTTVNLIGKLNTLAIN